MMAALRISILTHLLEHVYVTRLIKDRYPFGAFIRFLRGSRSYKERPSRFRGLYFQPRFCVSIDIGTDRQLTGKSKTFRSVNIECSRGVI